MFATGRGGDQVGRSASPPPQYRWCQSCVEMTPAKPASSENRDSEYRDLESCIRRASRTPSTSKNPVACSDFELRSWSTHAGRSGRKNAVLIVARNISFRRVRICLGATLAATRRNNHLSVRPLTLYSGGNCAQKSVTCSSRNGYLPSVDAARSVRSPLPESSRPAR